MKRILFTAAAFASLLPAQQKKIVVTGMGTAWVEEMKSAAPNVTFVTPKPAELLAQIADAQICHDGRVFSRTRMLKCKTNPVIEKQ